VKFESKEFLFFHVYKYSSCTELSPYIIDHVAVLDILHHMNTLSQVETLKFLLYLHPHVMPGNSRFVIVIRGKREVLPCRGWVCSTTGYSKEMGGRW